jgi:hypothetical protein
MDDPPNLVDEAIVLVPTDFTRSHLRPPAGRQRSSNRQAGRACCAPSPVAAGPIGRHRALPRGKTMENTRRYLLVPSSYCTFGGPGRRHFLRTRRRSANRAFSFSESSDSQMAAELLCRR